MNDAVFPFNLPFPTNAYVILYVASLIAHVYFMAYVLAGSVYLAWAAVLGRLDPARRRDDLVTILRDWLPFSLSGAITAGIAPLLFVQILYQEEFYTANLLSFHRGMAIVPVLIVAFYLLYLLKAHRLQRRSALLGVIAVCAASAILFTAWWWVENHLLSIDRSAWVEQYRSEAVFYADTAVAPRLLFWIASAFPTAAVLILWQIRSGASGIPRDSSPDALRRFSKIALIALPISVAFGAIAISVGKSGGTFDRIWTNTAPYVLLALAGVAVQGWAFFVVAKRATATRSILVGATIANAATWIGMIVLREHVRLARLPIGGLFERHEEIGKSGGLWVFLVFLLITIAVVATVFRVVSAALRRTTPTS